LKYLKSLWVFLFSWFAFVISGKFVDFSDIFTGGDLMAGAISGNPALFFKGLVGKGIKEYTKFLNNEG
jgi:hypothetical protein